MSVRTYDRTTGNWSALRLNHSPAPLIQQSVLSSTYGMQFVKALDHSRRVCFGLFIFVFFPGYSMSAISKALLPNPAETHAKHAGAPNTSVWAVATGRRSWTRGSYSKRRSAGETGRLLLRREGVAQDCRERSAKSWLAVRWGHRAASGRRRGSPSGVLSFLHRSARSSWSGNPAAELPASPIITPERASPG